MDVNSVTPPVLSFRLPRNLKTQENNLQVSKKLFVYYVQDLSKPKNLKETL